MKFIDDLKQLKTWKKIMFVFGTFFFGLFLLAGFIHDWFSFFLGAIIFLLLPKYGFSSQQIISKFMNAGVFGILLSSLYLLHFLTMLFV